VLHESVNALQMKLRKLQMSITSWMPDELMMLMRVVSFQNILKNMNRPWFHIVWFFTLLHLDDYQWVVGKHIFCCLWHSKTKADSMRREDSTISPSTPPSSLPKCRAKHYNDKNNKENKRRRKAFIIFSIFVSWNMIVFYASPPKINDNIECLVSAADYLFDW
jgi:hypothetical protein